MNNIIFMWDSTDYVHLSKIRHKCQDWQKTKLTKFNKTEGVPKRVSLCSVSNLHVQAFT